MMTRLADIKAHESEVQDPEALAKYHELGNSVCYGTTPDLVMKLWQHSDDVAAAIQSWHENMEAQVLQQERDTSKDRMSQYERPWPMLQRSQYTLSINFCMQLAINESLRLQKWPDSTAKYVM